MRYSLAALAVLPLGLSLAAQVPAHTAHPTAYVAQPSTVQVAGALPVQDDPAHPEFYPAHVKPIFDQHCQRCHEGSGRRGGLNFDTREALLKGGHHGPAVVPGDPASSWLVRLIRHEGPADDPMPMPPRDPKLSDAEIATVTQWVKAGALMPAPAQ